MMEPGHPGTTGVPAQPSHGPHGRERKVHMVVGFPPGGPMDMAARFICPLLSERLGETFEVENLPGQSGNAAAASVVSAAPDGQTLLLCAVVNTINTTLFPELRFDFERDLVAVAGLYRVPLVVEVHPSVPARDAGQLIELARRRPGELRVGYAGRGTPQHIAIELFKRMAGVDLALVPYAGSAAVLEDLLAGGLHAMFDPMPSSIEHIRAGRLRPLAVTASERLPTLPDVPVMSDVLPGYEAGSWFGISAPAGTAVDRIRALNAATNAALAEPINVQRMKVFGATPLPGSPEAFAAFIRQETCRHAQAIAAARVSS